MPETLFKGLGDVNRRLMGSKGILWRRSYLLVRNQLNNISIFGSITALSLIKLISFCLLTTLSSSPFAQIDSSNRFFTYEGASYRIAYPTSWIIDTSGRTQVELFIFSPKENENDKFRENVNLIIQDLGGQNIDLDKYAKISEEQIKNLATDGKIFDSQKIKNVNSEYYRIIYAMAQGVFNLKIEQYFFVENNRAFVLTYTAEQDKFDTFKTPAGEILNSFTTKK